MPKKERAAKAAAIALAHELDSEMSEEAREKALKSGMGVGGGVNKGEDQLFGAPRARRAPALRPEACAAPPSPASPVARAQTRRRS